MVEDLAGLVAKDVAQSAADQIPAAQRAWPATMRQRTSESGLAVAFDCREEKPSAALAMGCLLG